MQITVKYFASLRERIGQAEERLDVSDHLTVGKLWERVLAGSLEAAARGENDAILAAVNHDYVEHDYELKDGDEVAFFPPVTGG